MKKIAYIIFSEKQALREYDYMYITLIVELDSGNSKRLQTEKFFCSLSDMVQDLFKLLQAWKWFYKQNVNNEVIRRVNGVGVKETWKLYAQDDVGKLSEEELMRISEVVSNVGYVVGFIESW